MASDKEILKTQARLGLTNLYYLGTNLLKLGQDELVPRPAEEVKPIYDWVGESRPAEFDRRHGKQAKWKRFLCIPRYCAKTYIVLVWLLQQILKNPDIRICIFGQQKESAAESAGLILSWLELPKIVELYGAHKSRKWSAESFTSAQRTIPHRDPTVRTVGLENPLEGKRCHIFFWDDLIGKKNNNIDGVMKVEKALAASIPLLVPGGTGIYACTRWGPQDPATEGKTFTGESGILRKWKEGGSWDAFGPRGYFGAYAKEGDERYFPGKKPGEFLFPSVWNEETIAEARVEMVKGLFASQVLNEPRPADSVYFSEENLQYFSERDPENNARRNPLLDGGVNFMSIDPASGEDMIVRGDETVITVGRFKWVGNITLGYIVYWKGNRWVSHRVIDECTNLILQWRPKKFFIEVNMGRGWLTGPMKRRFQEEGIATSIIQEVVRSQKNEKELWIEELQHAYTNEQIFFENHLRNSPGEEQTLQWAPGLAVHDDYPDSLAILWKKVNERKWGRQSAEGRGWKVGSARARVIYPRVG